MNAANRPVAIMKQRARDAGKLQRRQFPIRKRVKPVIDSGDEVSGCTVHFVDNQYDHGPIILQRTCPVLLDDEEHSLAARVFEQECLAYPDAIRLFAEDRLRVSDGKVTVLDPENCKPPKPGYP